MKKIHSAQLFLCPGLSSAGGRAQAGEVRLAEARVVTVLAVTGTVVAAGNRRPILPAQGFVQPVGKEVLHKGVQLRLRAGTHRAHKAAHLPVRLPGHGIW